MKIPLKYGVLTVLLLFCLCLVYGTHAYFFFAQELRNQHITATVRIGIHSYSVDKGVVLSEDGRTTGITALRALRIAYGKALAERSPLMGLEGTDPEALRTQTALLKETMDKISLLQDTSEDAELVKNALYPIDFLYALASLESARKQFIASGSETDFNSYERLFNPVFKSGISASERLLDGFIYETRSGYLPRIVGFSGTITATSSRRSLESIPDSLSRIQGQATRRFLCLSGVTWMCPTLSPPTIPESQTLQPSQTDADTRVTFEKNIASILRSVVATTRYDKLYAPVRLRRSACLAAFPSPHNLETSILLRTNFDLFHYLDDIYFIPTAGESGPVPEFLRDRYGLKYLKINPMTFYLCPHLVEDVAVAQAILQTAAIARKYDDIPNSHRTTLIAGVPAAEDAIAYIREATTMIEREPLPAAYIEEVLSTSLTFVQKSAGLDAVVAHIAYVNEHDLALKEGGAPFDLTAKTLFQTHAAAPSLFLFRQIGALSPLAASTADDWRNLNNKFESYSNLRQNITDDVIIHQIRIMDNIEKRGL